MSETYLLEMNKVTKRFPGVVALKDVTFKVRQGVIHGLVGENGAGKSTLMKILSGTYPTGSYEGELKLNGKVLDLHSSADALEQGIGIVPQETFVVEQLTVAENIVIGKWIEGTGRLVSMRASISSSMALVASSINKTRGRANNARATINCCSSPTLKCRARSSSP